jgi:hypothetical protein
VSYHAARIRPLEGPHVGFTYDGVVDSSDPDNPLAAYYGWVSNQLVPCVTRRFSVDLVD